MIRSLNLKQRLSPPPFICLSLGFVLAMPWSGATAAPTNIRPIEDFVNQQGTFCLDDGAGGCFLFVPPVGNFLGFSDPDTSLSISVDYAGLADRWIQSESGGTQSIGTEFSGTIVERPLADGRAEVKVNLHFDDALTWAVDGFDYVNDPLVLGNRAPDVLAGATPALSDGVFQLSFINSEPGAPLPDLLQLFVAPEPGQEPPTTLKARYTGEGITYANERLGLEEGGLARIITSQTGLFGTSANPDSALGDGFPVEMVEIHPIRRSVQAVPEPSSAVLVGLGLVGLLTRRRSHQ